MVPDLSVCCTSQYRFLAANTVRLLFLWGARQEIGSFRTYRPPPAAPQPVCPIRPQRLHILWGARQEIGSFRTYRPPPRPLPSRAGRSGPAASKFYGVRGGKSGLLEHTGRPPAAPPPGRVTRTTGKGQCLRTVPFHLVHLLSMAEQSL